MKKLILLLTIIVQLQSSDLLLGQTDTLNKLSTSGKKNGYWKVFLDEHADPVESIEKACFYGIELYDNGEHVQKYYKHKVSGLTMKFDGVLPPKGKPELINGTFTWFDNKGFLQSLETYKNGQPLYIKSYHVLKNKTDTINHPFEDLDFTIKFNNIAGTFYYREHHLDSTFTEYWFRKGKRGWRVYKIKE
ncbi:MAG: hypothetical protein IT236_14405 [Bacteroidia bacterium]|nr:hypothetical protein [Bacteroidia bacterium]